MKTVKKIVIFLPVVLAVLIAFLALEYYNLLPKKYYSAADFGIETVKSESDFNQNGIDDYTDIMLGARIDAKNKPKYNGAYYAGGYPPDNIGVCTDVVWRAFKNAGFNLRDMVDKDITLRKDEYVGVDVQDKNIDFRRVINLRTFFEKYGMVLSCDTSDISAWQPGDIVIFNGNEHIGIVSDRRNSNGQPYIIHNGGQPNREEDYLKRATVSGHYRFDATKLDSSVLVKW